MRSSPESLWHDVDLRSKLDELGPRSVLAAWVLPALALILHLSTARGYGYFRDELYYLACGEHLDFGYVDHPPLIALIAAGTRAVLGSSVYALRFPSALAAALTIAIAAATARQLGGGRFAQVLAAVSTLLAPIYVSLFTILSMNAFDVLAWAASFWILARILSSGGRVSDLASDAGTPDAASGGGLPLTASPGPMRMLWIALGVVLGVGLENKISVLFLGFGLVTGFIAARRWSVFRDPSAWLAGGIALLLFLPHIVWQQAHGWPTLEFMENASTRKNVALAPGDFLSEHWLHMGPLSAIVAASGLSYFLFARRAEQYRVFGWAYLAILIVMLCTNAKVYYLAPVCTILFAGGSVAIESWTTRRMTIALRAAVLCLVVASNVALAPLAKPLLSEDGYVRYAARLGLQPSAGERHEIGRLPQFFADMHGWPELAETVARVYHALSAEDRTRAFIFAQNYGQAGAIDFFGPALGIPKAISAHNSYFLWGPRDCTAEVVIVIDDDRESLDELFEEVELGATYTCTDCMPYENNKSIWIARRLRGSISGLWSRIKNYI